MRQLDTSLEATDQVNAAVPQLDLPEDLLEAAELAEVVVVPVPMEMGEAVVEAEFVVAEMKVLSRHPSET